MTTGGTGSPTTGDHTRGPITESGDTTLEGAPTLVEEATGTTGSGPSLLGTRTILKALLTTTVDEETDGGDDDGGTDDGTDDVTDRIGVPGGLISTGGAASGLIQGVFSGIGVLTSDDLGIPIGILLEFGGGDTEALTHGTRGGLTTETRVGWGGGVTTVDGESDGGVIPGDGDGVTRGDTGGILTSVGPGRDGGDGGDVHGAPILLGRMIGHDTPRSTVIIGGTAVISDLLVGVTDPTILEGSVGGLNGGAGGQEKGG